jgi:hypothetical protein
VYNQQYWFRMFGLAASFFPLCARLVGHWMFNELTCRFLLAHPPTGWNIDDVTDGFDDFLAKSVSTSAIRVGARGAALPRAAFVEAARIDAAWRRVFLAPAQNPFRPGPADGARLLSGRLTLSSSVAIVEEHWPLVELRGQLADDRGEEAVSLPARLSWPQYWAIARSESGIGHVALQPREARLFGLLPEHSVAEALALLEAECTPADRDELPAQARGWLARSMRLEFWSGLDARPQ